MLALYAMTDRLHSCSGAYNEGLPGYVVMKLTQMCQLPVSVQDR